jgi:hypothetical protein
MVAVEDEVCKAVLKGEECVCSYGLFNLLCMRQSSE